MIRRAAFGCCERRSEGVEGGKSQLPMRDGGGGTRGNRGVTKGQKIWDQRKGEREGGGGASSDLCCVCVCIYETRPLCVCVCVPKREG